MNIKFRIISPTIPYLLMCVLYILFQQISCVQSIFNSRLPWACTKNVLDQVGTGIHMRGCSDMEIGSHIQIYMDVMENTNLPMMFYSCSCPSV